MEQKETMEHPKPAIPPGETGAGFSPEASAEKDDRNLSTPLIGTDGLQKLVPPMEIEACEPPEPQQLVEDGQNGSAAADMAAHVSRPEDAEQNLREQDETSQKDYVQNQGELCPPCHNPF